jgi:hypothetical protein
MIYKFSIGKLKLKQGGSTIKEIIATTEIAIDYRLSTKREYNESGVAIDEMKEEEQLTLTCTFATNAYEPSIIQGDIYDLVLEAGVNGGGVTATIANCKLTGYSVRQVQNDFSTTTITFSKIGPIDSAPGASITKQRVKFGSVYLGDSATLTPSYEGGVQSLIIPTALGILIRSTGDMGGGAITISINGYVAKTTRLELEQYLINLYSSLSTASGTLTVEYGGTSYTIPSCYFQSGRPESGKKNHTSFELTFLKSAF